MKLFQSTLLGATFLAGAGVLCATHAADIYAQPSLKDGPMDYMPAITWSGFYLGANLGAAFTDAELVGEDNDTVFIGGLHLGYNWQRPNDVLLGLEGDVDFGDHFDYLASFRGRLGWAAGRTLFYGTGGVAFVGLDSDLSDDSNTGWVAGLGIEHKVRPDVSVGLEGLYYDFDGDQTVNDDTFWTLRARLTYHFGGVYDGLK